MNISQLLKRAVFIIFYLVVLKTLNLSAQNPTVRYSIWNDFCILGKINPKWSWQLDLHYRRVSDPNSSEPVNLLARPSQHLYGIWVHFEPSKQWRFSLSPITYSIAFSGSGSTKVFEPEIRPGAQIVMISKFFDRLTMHNRIRYEYRMIGSRSIQSGGEFDYDSEYDFPVENDIIKFGTIANHRHRFRYMLRFILPLGKSKTIVNNSFYLVNSNEVFLHLYNQIPSREIFDQHRIYLLLGYKIPSTYPIRLEIGYGLRTSNRINYISTDNYTQTTDLMNIVQFYLWFDNVHLFFKKEQKQPPNQ